MVTVYGPPYVDSYLDLWQFKPVNSMQQSLAWET